MNPFVLAARKLSESIHGNRKAASILPFRDVKSVVVFLDPCAPDAAEAASRIEDFFAAAGKQCRIFGVCPKGSSAVAGLKGVTVYDNKALKWYGRLKHNKKTPSCKIGEDLFINLCVNPPYAVEYAAKCSAAGMKVGTEQLGGSKWPIICGNCTGHSQTEIFNTLGSLISLVK